MLNFQIFISTISGTEVIFSLLIILSLLLLYSNHLKDFYKIFFTTTSAMSITFLLKQLFKIPRPEHMLVIEDGFRFPSGHATMAGVVSTLVFLYTHKYIKNSSLRYVLYLFSFIWLPLVSYSRLYLGVHYFIDVLVGGLVGTISTFIIMRVFKHFHYYR